MFDNKFEYKFRQIFFPKGEIFMNNFFDIQRFSNIYIYSYDSNSIISGTDGNDYIINFAGSNVTINALGDTIKLQIASMMFLLTVETVAILFKTLEIML